MELTAIPAHDPARVETLPAHAAPPAAPRPGQRRAALAAPPTEIPPLPPSAIEPMPPVSPRPSPEHLHAALRDHTERVEGLFGKLHTSLEGLSSEVRELRHQAPSRSHLWVVMLLWVSMLIAQLVAAANHGVDVQAIANAVAIIIRSIRGE